MDLKEENDSEIVLWSENEKLEDFYLTHNGEEGSSENGYIKSIPIESIKHGQETSDEKKPDLSFSTSFNNIKVESNDRSIDKEFDYNILETSAIKKETNDVCEIKAEELNYDESSLKLEIIFKQEQVHIKDEENIKDRVKDQRNYNHESFIKLEIKQEEVHIKDEDLIKDTVNERIHQCSECPFKTSRRSDLNAHIEIHNKLMLNRLKRSHETLRASNLNEDLIKLITEDNVQWLLCPECSYKTTFPSVLRIHMLAHISDAFKCSKCSYQARRKSQLTAHQVKHESIDKWFSCPLCPFTTYLKSTLVIHCRKHHNCNPNNPKQIEVFKCTECSYEDGYKRNVKNHQLTHNPSSWLQCPDCEYKTPYKSSLKKHQVRHQEESAEGWHRCPECSYKTAYKNILRRHFISHKTADEIECFECSQCRFKTTYKQHLRPHLLKHREIKQIAFFFVSLKRDM